jgi:CRP/FNR family cyclic AMP-dependent transcriptional regulator
MAKVSEQHPMIPKISQEVLVEMVGTARPRINEFMNKFRKLGFIDYNGGLHIPPSSTFSCMTRHQRHRRR